MKQIRCEISEKLLAVVNDRGLWLWCKECRRNHLFSLADLTDEKKDEKVLAISESIRYTSTEE